MSGRRTVAPWMVLLVLVAATSAPLGVAGQQVPGAAPSLYSRLGGYDFIARFVDTAFPRVAGNPELSRLFRGHSRDSQMRQRQLIVDALCQHTGGPCIYIGRDLTAVHKGLGITDEDWRVFMSIISGTLRELGVPADVQRDFAQMFEQGLRATVVVD
jgi:hemoglobin